MHAPLLALAVIVATHSVSEIAGPSAADALNPAVLLFAPIILVVELALIADTAMIAAMRVNAAMAQAGKREQLAIELFVAIT